MPRKRRAFAHLRAGKAFPMRLLLVSIATSALVAVLTGCVPVMEGSAGATSTKMEFQPGRRVKDWVKVCAESGVARAARMPVASVHQAP